MASTTAFGLNSRIRRGQAALMMPSRQAMSGFGTFRTQRDVRLESVMRFKADIGERKQGSASRSRPTSLTANELRYLIVNPAVLIDCEAATAWGRGRLCAMTA
jgi:hypothetical protein